MGCSSWLDEPPPESPQTSYVPIKICGNCLVRLSIQHVRPILKYTLAIYPLLPKGPSFAEQFVTDDFLPVPFRTD